jgi:ABC-type nitrate/sulfonate/bicarbonate transport system substrate-binding protein
VARSVCLLWFLFLLLATSVAAQDRYVVSYGGFSGYQVPIWVTKELGLLDKYNIRADLVMMPGSSRQMQALLGGSIQFSQIDATAPVTAYLQGANLVIVAGALNKFPFSIVARPEIRKPSDLIGKRIGIVNFGGQNELSVLMALKEWNIPKEAVKIIPAGPSDSRLVALTTKALDATVLAPPQTIQAEKLGLRTLVHMNELKAAFPLDTIVVHRSFLKQHRGVVKRFLQAFIEGLHVVMTNKEKTVDVYQKILKQKDRAIVEKTYDYYAPQFSMPPRVSLDGLRTTAEFVAKKGNADVQAMLDESLLDELQKEGFFNKLKP